MTSSIGPVEDTRYKWKALLTVGLGIVLSTLDGSIITLAFPELTRVFNADLTEVMWITIAYILVSSGLMLTFGKLSDYLGRKRIFTAGTAVFTIGLAACSVAQSLEQIILFRVIQAVGTTMIMGCSSAIITDAFPDSERGRGLGLLGAAVYLGFILGPALGGFLLEWLDWRAIFYLRIPPGILAFAVSWLLLRKDTSKREKINLDLWGTFTSFAGLFCLLFGITQVKASGLLSPRAMILIGAGFIFLYLFLIVEKRVKEPIFSLGLFRNRTFSSAVSGFFIYFLAVPPMCALILPFYLTDAVIMPPRTMGLLLSVIPVVTMIFSPISGFFSDRFGPRWPSTIGAGMVALSFLGMLWFGPQTGVWALVAVFLLLGMGMGTFTAPNNSAIMGAVGKDLIGSASALIATNRQVATTIGMTVIGTIFSISRETGLSSPLREATASAFHDVALAGLFLSVAVLVLSLASPKRSQKSDRIGRKVADE